MVYFLVRLVVNAVAVAVAILLIPGIDIEPNAEYNLSLPVILLILGVLFGLINSFVRPFVLLVTGRLVIWTMGLFIFIINGLLFWVLSYLAPNTLIIKNPSFLWMIVAGAIMGVTVTLLEAVFGLDSPVIDDDRKSRFYWRWLGLLSTGRRNRLVENLRLAQVYATIRRYGIDLLVDVSPLAGIRRYMQRILYPRKHALIEESAPETVRLMLQELGPMYVKLGQMLASRSEILPEDWQAELSKLQSEAKPFPYQEARKIITAELGSPPEELYRTFEQVPFAAASTAQIHRATLRDGEDVVVKVQRPDIDVTVKGDLNVMQDVINTLERRARWARDLGLSGMLCEFADNVIEELDYRNEAYNARRLKHSMGEFDFVHVPEIYGEYSTSKVLTMEYVQGVKMTEIETIDGAGIDREELAHKFVRVMNKQVLLDGFFHGDPHPGNVLVNLDNGGIIFLDLGLMGRMTDEQRLALFDIIWSLKNGDSRNLTRLLLQLSTQSREVDEERLTQDIDRLVQRYVVYAEGNPKLSDIVQKALDLLIRYGLILERSLTIALKGLMQAEELVRTLAPGLSFIHTAVDEVQAVLLDQADGEVIYEKLKDGIIRTAKDVVVRWPVWKHSAGRWLAQLEEGRFTLHIDSSDFNRKIDDVDRRLGSSVQQLVLGLLLVGMLLGSAIISTVPLEDLALFEFLPQELFIGIFIIVAALSLIYVLRIIWNSWRNR